VIDHPAFSSRNVAVITGAASGIGLATATRCATFGMHVVLADLPGGALETARSNIAAILNSGRVIAVATDVSRLEDVERLRDAVYGEFSAISVLMNNAGIEAGGGAFAPITEWRKVIETNLWGVTPTVLPVRLPSLMPSPRRASTLRCRSPSTLRDHIRLSRPPVESRGSRKVSTRPKTKSSVRMTGDLVCMTFVRSLFFICGVSCPGRRDQQGRGKQPIRVFRIVGTGFLLAILSFSCFGQQPSEALVKSADAFNAGVREYEQHHLEAAADLMEQGLEGAQGELLPDDPNLGKVCGWLGVVRFELHQMNAAKALLERADKVLSVKSEPTPPALFVVLKKLSELYHLRKEYDLADHYLVRLQGLHVEDSPGFVATLRARADLAREAGAEERGETLGKEALEAERRWYDIDRVREEFSRETGGALEYKLGEMNLDDEGYQKLTFIVNWLINNQGRYNHVAIRTPWFDGAENCQAEAPALQTSAMSVGRAEGLLYNVVRRGLPRGLVSTELREPDRDSYPRDSRCELLRTVKFVLD
jgi:tetratricopeptide (TPR) repeat protein